MKKPQSTPSADDPSRGGAHYKELPNHLQHWNVVVALDWDYFIGCATKHLWRLGKKKGVDPIEDITKAIHYLEKKREIMLEERKLED